MLRFSPFLGLYIPLKKAFRTETNFSLKFVRENFFDNLVIFMAYTKVSRKLSKEDMSDANPYLLGPPPLRPTLRCGLWCEIAGRTPTKVRVAHSHDHFFSDGPVKFRGRQQEQHSRPLSQTSRHVHLCVCLARVDFRIPGFAWHPKTCIQAAYIDMFWGVIQPPFPQHGRYRRDVQ